MSHKAFLFDWNAFDGQLHALVEAALASDDTTALEAYIDEHRNELRDPYEGAPLADDWRSRLKNRDVQLLSDYALTHFYNPADDFGLGDAWSELSDELSADAAAGLLGFSIGPASRPFDPGRLGSYFQSAETAARSLVAVQPLDVPELSDFVALLEQAVSQRFGIYVTF